MFFFSMDSQDEEMDSAPLQETQPLFITDKDHGKGGEEEEDGVNEEDPDCPADMEVMGNGDDDNDDEVSICKKTSVNGGKAENGNENGEHHSSEESDGEDGEEEERDQGDQTTAKMAKFQMTTLLAESHPPLQTPSS